jgi:S1-C subfamily serine protease
VRAVNGVMPQDVRTLYTSLRDFLNQSGFPPVFGDLPTPPNVNVPPPDQTLPQSVQQEVARAHLSTFKVYGEAPRCGRGIEGSGFVFAPHHVMTNAHVVAGTSQVAVQVSPDRNLAATVVLYDPERDVAVLDVPGLNAPSLSFAADTAKTGDPAVVLGYPQDGPFTVRSARIRTRTTVSGSDIYGKGTVRREIYAVRAQIRSGNSGGPLLDDGGSVLGVVFATALDAADTGYALSAGEVAVDASRGRNASVPVGTGACTPG